MVEARKNSLWEIQKDRDREARRGPLYRRLGPTPSGSLVPPNPFSRQASTEEVIKEAVRLENAFQEKLIELVLGRTLSDE